VQEEARQQARAKYIKKAAAVVVEEEPEEEDDLAGMMFASKEEGREYLRKTTEKIPNLERYESMTILQQSVVAMINMNAFRQREDSGSSSEDAVN